MCKWTISIFVLLLCVTSTTYSQSTLTLEWRQPLMAGSTSYLQRAKPLSIKESLTIKGTVTDHQYVILGTDPQPESMLAGSDGVRWRFSQDRSVIVAEETILDSASKMTEDSPVRATAFSGPTALWRRTINSAIRTLPGNAGVSVDLEYAVASLSFYDAAGHLIRNVQPFGKILPWSLERPAFGAWSPDSSRFALLATDSDDPYRQLARLFVYDSRGSLLYTKDMAPLKWALAVGVSRGAEALVVVGETGNRVFESGVTVQAMLLDGAGRTTRTVTMPSAGKGVVVTPIDTTTDFTVDNEFGAIIRLGLDLEPVTIGTDWRALVSAAATADLTAIATLDTASRAASGTIHVQLLNRYGAPLLDRTLEGNTTNLKELRIWLAKNHRFMAIQFADEIRYYRLTL